MSENDKQDPEVEAERAIIEATPDDSKEAPVDTASDDSAPEPDDAAPVSSPPARRGGRAALILAVVALLLAAGVAGLGHYRFQQLDNQFSALPPAIERNAGRLSSEEQRSADLSSAIEEQKAALARQSGNLEEAIGALRAQIGRDQSGWVMAETEYLMLVANHRLQLERDVVTAVAALQIADERLREIGDPALIEVREKLAAEITALNTIARPDLTGLALRLMGLGGQVERLTLKGGYQPAQATRGGDAVAAAEAPAWRRLIQGIWSDLKGLVTVRRTEEAVRPMLAPEQQYFLRQNLRLQLEAARLALLRTDTEQLRMALQTAQEWIGLYFDERSEVARGMQEEISAIAGVEIRPALPDISGSLNALRAHMRQTARQE
ncbi:MAG: hypothetical protein DWQ09_03020 [Proteobacteria bacterium]|nr:MAG: hypothetical protein DWQ09_03020 [Pseudomonadota bacterium]